MEKAKVALMLAALLVPFGTSCAKLKRFAYEGFGRDKWQQPERVIDALGLAPGNRIADLGAGGGYFTFRLADAVGPNGRVYAVDIDKDMTDYLRKRATDDGYRNVEVILATPNDPQLPQMVDVFFTSDTYHHIENPTAYFTDVHRYLSANARVAIIDHNGKGWFAGLFGHFTPAEKIHREMEAAGYQLEKQYDFIAQQNFLVFTQKPH